MTYLTAKLAEQIQEMIVNQWDYHPNPDLPDGLALGAYDDGIYVTDGNCIMGLAVKLEKVSDVNVMVSQYEVIVSNIGTVHTGTHENKARKCFNEYVKDSKTSYGRVSGESVTLFCDGEIIKEYIGANENE